MMGKNFTLVRYSGEQKTIWDQVIGDSKNGNFLHMRDYMGYHAHRFDEQSVIVFAQERPVAVFPCNRVGQSIISHGGLTYGGLIYGRRLHTVEVLEVFDQLATYFRDLSVDRVLYKAIPHVFHKYPCEEDLYALHCLKARVCRRDISSVINLDCRIKFSDSRKCTIRKSKKQGVVFREGQFFDEFHQLLSQVIAKFGSEPVHSHQELLLLRSRFPDNIRLFGAFSGNLLLAGAIIYDFGHVVHTQYLAASDKGRELGALDFVLAQLIEETFAKRQYFSFGISTENDGRQLNEGLIFQKEGFGARGVVHDFYQWNLVKEDYEH